MIGANHGDGGAGGGLWACGEVGDESGTTFRQAGAHDVLVRWVYALHQHRGAQGAARRDSMVYSRILVKKYMFAPPSMAGVVVAHAQAFGFERAPFAFRRRTRGLISSFASY